jgi:hypothetical protein
MPMPNDAPATNNHGGVTTELASQAAHRHRGTSEVVVADRGELGGLRGDVVRLPGRRS